MGNIDWDKLGKLNVPMDFEEVLKNDMNINPTRYGYDTYSYQGIGVPRVSEIIKTCCDSSNLIEWAARVGAHKHEMYRDNALNVGSAVHECIDNYLNGQDFDVKYIAAEKYVGNDSKLIDQVNTAYLNFTYWLYYMNKSGYSVVTIDNEKEVICPLYGGTIDWIVNLIDSNNNTKKFIVDFKTSKSISSNYLLQTAAYRMAWNWLDYYYNGGNNYISGIGVIRLDKFTYLSIDYFFVDDYDLISRLEYDVRSMINWYYCQKDSIAVLKTINARSDFKNE